MKGKYKASGGVVERYKWKKLDYSEGRRHLRGMKTELTREVYWSVSCVTSSSYYAPAKTDSASWVTCRRLRDVSWLLLLDMLTASYVQMLGRSSLPRLTRLTFTPDSKTFITAEQGIFRASGGRRSREALVHVFWMVRSSVTSFFFLFFFYQSNKWKEFHIASNLYIFFSPLYIILREKKSNKYLFTISTTVNPPDPGCPSLQHWCKVRMRTMSFSQTFFFFPVQMKTCRNK